MKYLILLIMLSGCAQVATGLSSALQGAGQGAVNSSQAKIAEPIHCTTTYNDGLALTNCN